MDLINDIKKKTTSGFSIREPFIIQDPEKMLDMKLFLKNYSRHCFKLAISEYKIDSSFNIFQPQFLLKEYNKEARKYGVSSGAKDYLHIPEKEKVLKEDSLSFVADICALYVKNNNKLFEPSIQFEADSILNRKEQYVYDQLYLGFGYFIKRICNNGHYAAMAINDWFDRYLVETDLIFSFIVKEINFINLSFEADTYRQEPKDINMVCTYMFHKFISPRLLRMRGNFIKTTFELEKEQYVKEAEFQYQKVRINLKEIMARMNNYC